MPAPPEPASALKCLNESPSEKEGKSHDCFCGVSGELSASMKVPPKRKGNLGVDSVHFGASVPQ